MTKTQIPVEYVMNVGSLMLSAKRALSVSVPLFIAVLGLVLGWNLYESDRTTAEQRLLLGAVSESTVPAESQGVDNSEGGVSSLSSLASPEEERPEASVLAVNELSSAEQIPIEATPARTKEELERLIVENEVAIIRENSEISRIRNASIALVGEFDTNCGDWEDDCARYYVLELEKNNAAYNELALKIGEEERLLLELRSERALME